MKKIISLKEREEEKAIREFDEKWIDLLCKYNSKEEFEFVRQNSKSTRLAIMAYRRKQMQEGRGQDITLEQLQNANNTELQELLQEMFLEPILFSHIEFFYKNAVERGYTNTTDAIEELYKRHFEDKGTRFLTIVLTL